MQPVCFTGSRDQRAESVDQRAKLGIQVWKEQIREQIETCRNDRISRLADRSGLADRFGKRKMLRECYKKMYENIPRRKRRRNNRMKYNVA
jgi:hypothetical protein